MKNKSRILNYIFLSGSILSTILFFWFSFGKKESFNNNGENLSLFDNSNYYPSNIDVNFVNSVSVVYPLEKKRPLSTIGYLKEFLKEGIILTNIQKNWRFLSTKTIGILGINAKDIKVNWIYDKVEQAEQMENIFSKSKPRFIEFWKNDFYDTWEGGLGKYLFLVNSKIKSISGSEKTEILKIKEIINLVAVVSEHKKYLDYMVEISPKDEKEKKYLINTQKIVFDYIFNKIYSFIPTYDNGVFWYSFEDILKNKDFGLFDVWVSTNWLKSGEKAVLTLFYNEGATKTLKNIDVIDRYGLKAGEIVVDDSRDGLFFSLSSPNFKDGIDGPPKVWLRKKLSSTNDVSRIDVNLGKSRFRLFFLIFTFIFLGLFLVNNIIKKTAERTSKIYELFDGITIFLRSKYLYIVIISAVLFLISGTDWDLLIISVFLFWTLTIFVFNLPSGLTYFISLLFVIPGPYLVLSNKIFISETTVIFSYFFMFSGLLKQVLENTDNKDRKMDWGHFWQSNLKNIFFLAVLLLAIYIIGGLIFDIYQYKEFFGDNFLKEIVSRAWVKLILVWFVGIPVLLMMNRIFFRRFFGFFKPTKGNDFQNKVIVIIVFVFLSYSQNKILSFGSQTFVGKPYILTVFPSSAKIGESLKITGKNFLGEEPSATKKITIDGVEQKIIKWSGEEIVLEITDEYSNSGPVQIIITQGNRILKSNEIDFTLIDFTKDWTEMEGP